MTSAPRLSWRHPCIAKSYRFESTDFVSVMIDDIGCSRCHQCPRCGHTDIILKVVVKISSYHGLVQDCSNSSVLAMELLQSYAKSSLYTSIPMDSPDTVLISNIQWDMGLVHWGICATGLLNIEIKCINFNKGSSYIYDPTHWDSPATVLISNTQCISLMMAADILVPGHRQPPCWINLDYTIIWIISYNM